MELSERIKQLLKSKRVTPYEVSINTGISQAAISRMLSGVTGKINPKTEKALADYFSVDAYWVRTGEGEMTIDVKKSDVPAQDAPLSNIEIAILKAKLEEKEETIEKKDKKIEELIGKLALAQQALLASPAWDKVKSEGTGPPMQKLASR